MKVKDTKFLKWDLIKCKVRIMVNSSTVIYADSNTRILIHKDYGWRGFEAFHEDNFEVDLTGC